MSLLWIEGFDHYGTGSAGATIAEAGAWAELDNASPSTANPRTGTCALRIGLASTARRVLGGPIANCGAGGAFYLSQLPGASNRACRILAFKDAANNDQITLTIETTGTIGVWQGLTQIHTSTDLVYARSYFHLEAYVVVDSAAGALEVRVNGVTFINLTGIDTDPRGTGEVSQIEIAQGASAGLTMDVDDLFAWSGAGSDNNDFIGDKKVYTVVPNADTATEEWSLASGTDTYAMLDGIPPVDGSAYIYADAAGPKSVVELGSIPAEVVAIAGAMSATRAWKTDAGNAKVLPSVISGGTEDTGDEHALSQAPTYYHDVYETDPNTGAPWTVSGINAAQYGIERTE